MQQPSQMPGGRPFPSPRRAGNRQYEDEGFDETYDDEGFDETYDDAYEEENFDETYDDQGFDEAYEDEGFDEDMEAAGVRESWGQKVPLGENLTLRARIGYRAAVIPWKPGMFIVAEVPEDVARKEARRIKLGFDPVVTPLILKTVAKRLLNRPATPAAPEVKQGTIVVPVVSGNLPVPHHYARLGWADPADLAEIGCDCKARRRR